MYSKEIERIIDWFEADVIRFIDKVLGDDQKDPEYSAVTCSNQIITLIKVVEEYSEKYKSVEEYLVHAHYGKKDIKIFLKSSEKESKYYHGEILSL